jgi:hypothetical protein
MSYSTEISRNNPTCFVFLLDQSLSMADPFGGGEGQLRKADILADVTNRTLRDLVIRSTKAEEIRDYYHIAVMGYGTINREVSSAFVGQLAGKSFAKISEVGEYPARVDNRVKKVPDGAGGLVDQPVRFPIWVDPSAQHKTPMCAALDTVRALVESWLREHPHCFPPVVLHITDGESTDGDPTSAARAITALNSTDGDVLLFNCHLSSQRAGTVEYPSDGTGLPNEFARMLFEMSSVMPAEFRKTASETGLNITEGSRGFVFNADPTALTQFFDIGTRPANLR